MLHRASPQDVGVSPVGKLQLSPAVSPAANAYPPRAFMPSAVSAIQAAMEDHHTHHPQKNTKN